MSSIDAFIYKIPIATLTVLCICVLVEILVFVFTLNINVFAISATNVISGGMYYTVLTSAFVHVSFMHIAFNMMSLLQLGM